MKTRWSRPFIIKKIMSGGATRITNLNGEEILRPINMDRLRKYNIYKIKNKKIKKEKNLLGSKPVRAAYAKIMARKPC